MELALVDENGVRVLEGPPNAPLMVGSDDRSPRRGLLLGGALCGARWIVDRAPIRRRVHGLTRIRIAVSGLVWAAVYNALWGVAWFTFMRHEWQTAFAVIGRPLAWTADVWFVWVIVTPPLGAAVMAHAGSGPRRLLLALRGALLLFVLFSLGMTIWGVQESLSPRVLVLDALVNAVSMPIASLAAVAALRPRHGAVPLGANEAAI
jgi:hypothetical protein